MTKNSFVAEVTFNCIPNIVTSEGLFRYLGISISRCLVLGQFPHIFSTAQALPALIVLRALANLLE